MQVKSYDKSDNVREKPEMWHDSTRGTIYTSPYRTNKAKAFPGHKQARNLYVRKPAFLCFYHAVSTYSRCCTPTRVSQITTAFAHKSVADKTKVRSSSWNIFFIQLRRLEKGKCFLFVDFTEQNICVNDWFSVNIMVTVLTGVAVTGSDTNFKTSSA